MNEAGIEIKSSSGLVQINSKYRNLHLIKKQDTLHYWNRSTGNSVVGPETFTPTSPNSIIAYGIDPWYEDVDYIPDAAVKVKDRDGVPVFGGHFTQPYFSFLGRRSYDINALMPSADVTAGDAFITGTSITSYVKSISTPSSGPVMNYGYFEHRETLPTEADNIKTSVYEFDFVDFGKSKSTFGMQVFDASGDVVFDAGYKPMRVVGFYSTPPLFTTNRNVKGLPTYWDLPVKDGSRKYAIAPLGTPCRFYNSYTGGYYDGRDYVSSSGHTVADKFVFQKSRIMHVATPVPINKAYMYQYLYTGMNTVPYLLLDVTGY